MTATFRVALEPAGADGVAELIEALDAYQRPLYPAASHHGIALDAVPAAALRLAVARSTAGRAVGCAALVLAAAYPELKRWYVQPTWRRHRVAQALLELIETEAEHVGCPALYLETGVHQPEAIAFYRRAGFVEISAFGHYRPDPHSLFMRKDLTASRLGLSAVPTPPASAAIG